MIVDLPRRWRWVVAAECALIAVLAVLFVLASRSAERQVQETGPTAAVVARPAPATLAASETAPLAPATATGVDEVEACGVGWMPASSDGTPEPAELVRREAPARERILSAMRTDSSELVRASAMLLDGSTLDALASAAVSSTDPGTYALAFQRCYARAEGACHLLSAERWAQLDPLNAKPWVYIFEAARSRNDADAQETALFRIASAARSTTGGFSVAASVLGEAPDDDASQLAADSLARESIGIEAANVERGYREISAACRGDALKDANRLQTCQAIAVLLTEHSDSMREFGAGASLGRQVGWSADRADAMLGQRAAYEAMLAAGPLSRNDPGCAAVGERLDLVRQLLVGGHPKAMRDWVAQSGRSAEDFIQVARDRPVSR